MVHFCYSSWCYIANSWSSIIDLWRVWHCGGDVSFACTHCGTSWADIQQITNTSVENMWLGTNECCLLAERIYFWSMMELRSCKLTTVITYITTSSLKYISLHCVLITNINMYTVTRLHTCTFWYQRLVHILYNPTLFTCTHALYVGSDVYI